jgi:hypothetical protein
MVHTQHQQAKREINTSSAIVANRESYRAYTARCNEDTLTGKAKIELSARIQIPK